MTDAARSWLTDRYGAQVAAVQDGLPPVFAVSVAREIAARAGRDGLAVLGFDGYRLEPDGVVRVDHAYLVDLRIESLQGPWRSKVDALADEADRVLRQWPDELLVEMVLGSEPDQ